MKEQRTGFTLVEIMMVVFLIGLLAALAIPYGMKARERTMANRCADNLRQIVAAKEQAAFALGIGTDMEPTPEQLTPYFRSGSLPVCPSSKQAYSLGTMAELPTCATPGHGTN